MTLKKTFKREIGFLGVVFWGVLSWALWGADPVQVAALATPYAAMTYTVWGYCATAFGLHAWATQLQK